MKTTNKDGNHAQWRQVAVSAASSVACPVDTILQHHTLIMFAKRRTIVGTCLMLVLSENHSVTAYS